MPREFNHLEWPFFDDAHREMVHELEHWCVAQRLSTLDDTDVYAACRDLVGRLGEAGWLRYSVPSGEGGSDAGIFPARTGRRAHASEPAQNVWSDADGFPTDSGSMLHNTPIERLYRDIRALRIYEGATEVQKLIIARELLKS